MNWKLWEAIKYAINAFGIHLLHKASWRAPCLSHAYWSHAGWLLWRGQSLVGTSDLLPEAGTMGWAGQAERHTAKEGTLKIKFSCVRPQRLATSLCIYYYVLHNCICNITCTLHVFLVKTALTNRQKLQQLCSKRSVILVVCNPQGFLPLRNFHSQFKFDENFVLLWWSIPACQIATTFCMCKLLQQSLC